MSSSLLYLFNVMGESIPDQRRKLSLLTLFVLTDTEWMSLSGVGVCQYYSGLFHSSKTFIHTV